MNILQIINVASDYPGNLINSIWRLEEKMVLAGHTITYLFPQKAEGRNWVNSMIENGKSVLFKSENQQKSIKVILEICKNKKIDIIHLHFWNIPDCLSCDIAKVFLGIKVLIHHHCEYQVHSNYIKEKMKHILFNGSYHIGCSKWLYESLIEAGYNERKVFRVDNGVDFSRLSVRNTHEELMKNNGVFLTFSSASWYVKGIDITCKAIKILREKYQVELIVVASCQVDVVKECICKALGGEMPEWVSVVPSQNDVSQFYRKSLAFISASRTEGFCLSVLEASMCGCQPVMSDIPGHRTDLPNAVVFENENYEDLANKLCLIINQSSDKYTNVINEQKQYIENIYGIARWIDEIERIYEKII